MTTLSASLAGKTALVTGAGRGIGRAIARQIAGEGALVAVHYGASADAAHETVHLIEEDGGQAFTVQADVGSVAEITALFETLDRAFTDRTGTRDIDILVNNAGVGASVPIAATDEETYDRIFAINLKGLFFVSQQALPRLRPGGRVINISSLTARGQMMDRAAYGASKVAVNSLTKSFAQLLGPRSITVNALMPGLIETDLVIELMKNSAVVDAIVKQTALGRTGKPTDIASAVSLLVSDKAGWITGQCIEVTGGMRL
jgi:NAD(P)-dependent dehydrogenase (short-subunit alcohol dehydrogenase family)